MAPNAPKTSALITKKKPYYCMRFFFGKKKKSEITCSADRECPKTSQKHYLPWHKVRLLPQKQSPKMQLFWFPGPMFLVLFGFWCNLQKYNILFGSWTHNPLLSSHMYYPLHQGNRTNSIWRTCAVVDLSSVRVWQRCFFGFQGRCFWCFLGNKWALCHGRWCLPDVWGRPLSV